VPDAFSFRFIVFSLFRAQPNQDSCRHAYERATRSAVVCAWKRAEMKQYLRFYFRMHRAEQSRTEQNRAVKLVEVGVGKIEVNLLFLLECDPHVVLRIVKQKVEWNASLAHELHNQHATQHKHGTAQCE
jgi:hypothetical protein